MRLCNAWGIPHSTFLKEWSDEDRAKAIAFTLYENAHCQMCGTASWEWDEEQGGSRFAYEPYEDICPGCEKKDWFRDDDDFKPSAGGFVALKKPERTG